MRIIALGLLTACSAGDGVIVDDWGPPAGYAVLTGTVRHAGGAPAPGVEVAFSRCASPLGGFLAAATTDAAGRFRASGQLPPVGAFPVREVETLRLRCDVFLDRSGVARDSITVRFAPSIQAAPVTTIDLVAP